MKLEHRSNELTHEELYFARHSSGLGVYIIPKKDYSAAYAILGTRYGSVDSEFVVPGETQTTAVPDGIAHYLEHKMFDMPDGSNVFDKFSKLGGNANAYTSFNITAYLVSATDNINENIAVLMDYVQRPYFTEESVQKEQGIIGQEINMYDDNGGWKVFFNFLNCLYQNHPVKKEIAGTVESISHITHDYLYKCYNTFYNLSNMSIVVVGNVDPQQTAQVIEDNILKNEPFEEEIKKLYPNEPEEIASPCSQQSLSVAMPLFMLGFKDTDTGFGGDKLLKKNIEITILMRMLFGKSSKMYKELYEAGLINNSFSLDYTMQPDYGFSSIDGESPDPEKVYQAVLDTIAEARRSGLCEESFNRIKKVVWGSYIRSLNDVDTYANAFLQHLFMGIDYFDYASVYDSVTFEDVKKRFENHFRADRSALSVINPTD
ncbi:MAG: pitrilysin family protein [Clostridiales bacterium]|nr:pitrilysin family protein [Clostridiales bacterium]